jgi:hypothetical protein
VLVLFAAGTYAVNAFALSMARMNMSSTYVMTVGGMADQANSGPCLYLLLLNPAATFYAAMINGRTGDSQVVRRLNSWFGPHPDNFIMEHWVVLSIFIQLALAAIFMFISVKAISPGKGKKGRKTV